MQEQAKAIAEALIGTCEPPPDDLFEVRGLAEAFDELAFECGRCGWWCSTDELNEYKDEQFCNECKEDDDE